MLALGLGLVTVRAGTAGVDHLPRCLYRLRSAPAQVVNGRRRIGDAVERTGSTIVDANHLRQHMFIKTPAAN